jgi:hypothetical protein
MGLSSKSDRFNRTDGTRLGTGDSPLPSRMNQFERLEQFAKLQKPPAVKFKDLEASISSSIRYNTLPMQVRADFMKMTNTTIQTNVTIQFDKKDLQFQTKEGVSKSVINIYARVTSMARRVVNVFEDVVSVEVPVELLQQAAQGASIYQKSIFLAPGMYRLNVVAKDIIGNNMNNYEVAINVPRYDDEKLASSSLILADQIEKVPTRSIGTGQFVIGTSKVRPRLSEKFKRDEKMGIYMQLYNFQPDEKTQKPNGTVEYEIVKNGSTVKSLEFSEELNTIENASATQVTIEKVLPLKSMEPGLYMLKIKVLDKNKNQTLNQAIPFTVT